MNCCIPVSNMARQADLRSSSCHLLDILRTRTKLGERSFAVAGPAAWNALPVSVIAATSVDLLKRTVHLRHTCFGYHFRRALSLVFSITFHFTFVKCPCFYLSICYGTIQIVLLLLLLLLLLRQLIFLITASAVQTQHCDSLTDFKWKLDIVLGQHLYSVPCRLNSMN